MQKKETEPSSKSHRQIPATLDYRHMFTGIIEATGVIVSITNHRSNRTFLVESRIAKELQTGESVSHNGVCLTIEPAKQDSNNTNTYQVTAIAETLAKTAIGSLTVGAKINLERALKADGRIDGHFVQGHVDTVGKIRSIKERSGSTEYWIDYSRSFAKLIVAQGSICVNGISLTVSGLGDDSFAVNIIPHTADTTDAGDWAKDMPVNLEFDILGKYILRSIQTQ